MGFNTIHRNGECYLNGFNENNQTSFKYKELNQQEQQRVLILMGLHIEGASLVIQINGRSNINNNDVLSLADGRKYNVTSIGREHSPRPLIRRKDWDRVTGGIVVSLE